jgi:hypothetical protein
MNSKHIFNQKLKNFCPKSPVVFTFHINWKAFENNQLRQFNHIKNHFHASGIKNFEFLPILTDKRSNMDSRIRQFKQGIERIVDKYERKAHVIGYSFAGVLPRGYISLHNGDEYVRSLLTIGTPHQGSLFAAKLMARDFKTKWYMIEPALQAAGVDKEWFKEEYSRKSMHDLNNILISSPNVLYSSIGGRRVPVKCSESLKFIAETLLDNTETDIPNDGIVGTNEAAFGNHLINFDADHFELVGLRPNFIADSLFEFYSNAVKYADDDFKLEVTSEIGSEDYSKFTQVQANQSTSEEIVARY